MNERGKFIKKLADILAIVLIVMIFGGILSATGVISSIVSPTENDSPAEILALDPDSLYELDIEVASANIILVRSDTLYIETNDDNFKVKNKNGKISIEEKGNLFSFKADRKVTIFLPENFYFQKINLETGASNIEGDFLKAEYLELDIGAGLISLEKLEATKKAEIDCGAGEFTVKSGSLANLDFSLGVGKADITTELKSNADIESGVGELKLTLSDSKENYCFDIETGLGSIIFDGSSVKGETIIGNGENKIKLEGGVGSVNVGFTA